MTTAEMLVGFYWGSFALLLFTKLADIVSTIRSVPPEAETNPFARRLFQRLGFRRGLVLVSLLFLALAAGQYILVWNAGVTWTKILNTLFGLFIAWIQWDVARINTTGRPTRATTLAFRAYLWWGRYWRR